MPKVHVVLDSLDRKILGEMSRNSEITFSHLGEIAGLSAPATHERVKKLKANGFIRGQVALLDSTKVGKPLLAFVHIVTKGWGKSPELMSLQSFPEIEEIHSVAGDACLLLKVRVASSLSLEGVLAKIYKMPGVVGTKSYIVLSTYLERTTQAEISKGLEPTEVA